MNFYVQKDRAFNTANARITFDLEVLNEGGAMDIRSGEFIAPVRGLYHFEFTGVIERSIDGKGVVFFHKNGKAVGAISLVANITQGIPDPRYLLAFGTSLRLDVNDRVNLWLYEGGRIYDNKYHYTHFSGWLMEEEFI